MRLNEVLRGMDRDKDISFNEMVLGLCVPDRPLNRRERDRVHNLYRATAPAWHIVPTVRPGQNRERAKAYLDAAFKDAAVPWSSGDTSRQLDAVLMLGEQDDAASWAGERPRWGVWDVIEGDPRDGIGPGALASAIKKRRRYVGITLRGLPPGRKDAEILAFKDVPRRPFDSLKTLCDRLDSCLPLLIEDALARLRGGQEPFKPRTPPPWLAEKGVSAGLSVGERASDHRYAAHLLGRCLPPIMEMQGTRILALHDPAPDVLDGILSALGRIAPFIAYGEAIDALRVGKEARQGFVVTFDDGYRQNLALLDVLDRHRCPAMFFLNTGALDSDRALWFMNRDAYRPGQKSDFKKLGYRDFLSLIDRLGLTAPSSLRGRFALTSDEVRKLAGRGHEIGVHTENHPILSQDGVDLDHEIGRSFDRLKEILGQRSMPLHFAYPDGAASLAARCVLERLGAISAVTMRRGRLAPGAALLDLPRFPLGDLDYPGLALMKALRQPERR